MLLLLILIPAFYWLLYETYWLTIRLPFGKCTTISLESLVNIIPPIVLAGYLIANVFYGFGRFTKKYKLSFSLFRKLLPPKLPEYLR